MRACQPSQFGLAPIEISILERMTDDTANRFYDEFASHYHLIFDNWEASVTRQAAAINSILQRENANGRVVNVLDCACGIGTQALGLAKLGYHVTGSDISAGAVGARVRKPRCASSTCRPTWQMYDTRRAPVGGFDAVISMDNALPHLLFDADLTEAARQMRAKLRPRRTLLASIRDYDQLIRDRQRCKVPHSIRTQITAGSSSKYGIGRTVVGTCFISTSRAKRRPGGVTSTARRSIAQSCARKSQQFLPRVDSQMVAGFSRTKAEFTSRS